MFFFVVVIEMGWGGRKHLIFFLIMDWLYKLIILTFQMLTILSNAYDSNYSTAVSCLFF